jgi:gluconolactonase
MLGKGSLEVRDAAFHALLHPDSGLIRLATGFGFTEGPVWMAEAHCLLFSDIPGDEIWRWSQEGGVSSWRAPSHHSNGNTTDRQGCLITCEHGSRRVTRTDAEGQVTVLAEAYQGKRLNSPNDAVVKSDGTLWFTDPPYGVDRALVEQPANYVFRLDPEAAGPVALTGDLCMPNGLCFSPDEQHLYVADSSERAHVRRFSVSPDNTLGGGEVFASIGEGVPDGIRTDCAGRLFSTAADGVHVFAPDGLLLGKILTPEVAANCTFGGPGRDLLFITASTSLYMIHLNTRGALA